MACKSEFKLRMPWCGLSGQNSSRNTSVANLQMSQTGPFFWKISLLNVTFSTLLHRLSDRQVMMAKQMSSILPIVYPRCWGARWKFVQFPYIVFHCQSSTGTCQNLEGYAAMLHSLGNSTAAGRMHWHCPSHYIHMLWLLWIAFGVYFCQGLCAWQWTYSARISQLLAAHKLCRSPRFSGYHIQDYVAWKTTEQPTIHNTSHYSKIPSWHSNNAAGHKQTASGIFWLVQQRISLWLRMKWETAISQGFQLESFTCTIWFLLPVLQ